MNEYNQGPQGRPLQGQPQMSGTANITVRLEYVWLDGHSPKNIRSKVRYEEWTMDSNSGSLSREEVLDKIPEWNFDGSSTRQAETNNSDVVLYPVRVYNNPFEIGEIASFIVLCETYDSGGKPHTTNTRYDLENTIKGNKELTDGMWLSVEQEYTFIGKDGNPVGWEGKEQGENYCGVGSANVSHRLLVENHAVACMQAGINIAGTNAEVLLSQWEYQLTPKSVMETADDLWVSRYILHRLTEGAEFSVSLHPKPLEGEWNGAGAHINFSTEYMRENSDKEYIENVCKSLEDSHEDTIHYYGEDNDKRLTGTCETQSIDRFTYGVGDRGASIRIPSQTAEDWRGYLEDRRPAANMDPYDAFSILIESISMVKAETVEI